MDELELEGVGVGEEHGVVARFVAVLGWRIEHLNVALEEQHVEAVDLPSAFQAKWCRPGEYRSCPLRRPSSEAALMMTHCRLPAGEGIFQARRSSLFSASS